MTVQPGGRGTPEKEKVEPKPRSLGLLFGAIALIVGLWPLLNLRLPYWWLLGVAALLLLVALLRPRLLLPAAVAWAHLGLLLHRIINPVVMAVLYFLVLTPFGFVWRMLRRDPLGLRSDASRSSYLVRASRSVDAESLKRQF